MLRLLTRRLFLTALAASATMLAASTLPSAAQSTTLRYATGTDAQTLDPQFVTDIPTSRVVTQIHETLVYPNAEGEMEPVLAESWSVSDDNLSWTFKLREGVTFHDGTSFNAEAVKFTFDRIIDPAANSPSSTTACCATSGWIAAPPGMRLPRASGPN